MFVRSENVTLRREIFGGMAFHIKNGTTIELDREGEYLLETLSRPQKIRDLVQEMSKEFQREISEGEIEAFTANFIKMGFVKKGTHRGNSDLIVHDEAWWAGDNSCLCAPETVHFMVTNRCNLSCPLCYENKEGKTEMPKSAIFALIDKLAEMKVFQLAIGGGEPFLREDIFEIIEYCRKKRIVPNVTTNGTLVNDYVIKKIRHKVGGISVSLNGYSSDTNFGRDTKGFDDMVRGMRLLLAGGIPTGANVLVTHESLHYLHRTFDFLKKSGVKWVNVLRPKSGQGNAPVARYILSRRELSELKRVLNLWTYNLPLYVDTSLTCLMHTVPIQMLRENAVYGCVAGTRFCTIDCNGDVYPCSFFKNTEYLAGNVLEKDFQDIWLNSEIFIKFRKMGERLRGKCRSCGIRDYCGGCRSLVLMQSNDFYGEDEMCIKG